MTRKTKNITDGFFRMQIRIHAHHQTDIPEELAVRMRKHPEINWSAVARDAFKRMLDKLDGVKP